MIDIIIPPLKTQGIKTKLIPFIKESIGEDIRNCTIYIEPFIGSGCVAFNMQPEKALLCDNNPNIIRFYQDLQEHKITPESVRSYMEQNGSLLKEKGKEFYYEKRKEFNETELCKRDMHQLLFLNRSGFNGLMRFNSKGMYNTPYNHNDTRWSKAYITRVCNLVKTTQELLDKHPNWEFKCCDYKETLHVADNTEGSFVYLDPPYFGRNDLYYTKWQNDDTRYLTNWLNTTNTYYGFSIWSKAPNRENDWLKENCIGKEKNYTNHEYIIGPKQRNRPKVEEVLIINR